MREFNKKLIFAIGMLQFASFCCVNIENAPSSVRISEIIEGVEEGYEIVNALDNEQAAEAAAEAQNTPSLRERVLSLANSVASSAANTISYLQDASAPTVAAASALTNRAASAVANSLPNREQAANLAAEATRRLIISTADMLLPENRALEANVEQNDNIEMQLYRRQVNFN